MHINESKIIQDARISVAGVADNLVLSDRITAASEKLGAAAAAEQTAVDAATKAEANLVAARRAEDRAAHQPGADVMVAALAVESAERIARIAGKVLTGATSNKAAATTALAKARGEAYRPVAIEGAKRMVEAAKTMEQARKLMNDAFIGFRAGELLLAEARQAGAPVPASHQDGSSHRWMVDGRGDICLPLEAQERARWTHAGLLPVDGGAA